MQDGDISATYADIDAIGADLGFVPSTGIETGVRNFVDWYRAYSGD